MLISNWNWILSSPKFVYNWFLKVTLNFADCIWNQKVELDLLLRYLFKICGYLVHWPRWHSIDKNFFTDLIDKSESGWWNWTSVISNPNLMNITKPKINFSLSFKLATSRSTRIGFLLFSSKTSKTLPICRWAVPATTWRNLPILVLWKA